MASVTTQEISFLEKIRLYFKNYPGRCCDVSFVVGSGNEKEVIQTSRIILEITCPEFIKLFDEKWGQAVALSRNQGSDQATNEIPLPDVEPNAFKIFLKLLLLDDVDVSEDSLKNLSESVSSKDLLNLIELCRNYKMPKIQQSLEVIAQDTLFGHGFPTFSKTEEFLDLSQSNLNTILRNDNLEASETEIFEAAISWAKKRCSERNIENTGKNIREVLGDSLFRIRFPTMSSKEFTNNSLIRSILTSDEQLDTLRYIISKEQRSMVEETNVAFDKTERNRETFKELSIRALKLFDGFPIANSPPFVCDGKRFTGLSFQVYQKIEVHSFGFLGPIDSDSFFDVEVEIKYWDGSHHSLAKLKKRVFAKKSEIFYVSFDKPIRIKEAYVKNVWNVQHYEVHISLTGPNTAMPKIPGGRSSKDVCIETDEGIGFYCRVINKPLAELCFRKC